MRRAIMHVRSCPPSSIWWISNDSDWAPQIKCQACHLVYTPDTEQDQIIVEGIGRLPNNPTPLDLIALLKP